MPKGRPLRVLLVDDDEDDIMLTSRALKKSDAPVEIFEAEDGQACIEFLQGDSPRPDVIFLDLNMPRMNGHEALKAIRADEKLRSIPVVVLTTSDADKDILQSYGMNANAYVQKPVDLAKFTETVQKLGEFWGDVVQLP